MYEKSRSVWELLSENTHIEQQNAALVLSAKRPSQSVPHMKHQKPGLANSVGLKRHACTEKPSQQDSIMSCAGDHIRLYMLLESAVYRLTFMDVEQTVNCSQPAHQKQVRAESFNTITHKIAFELLVLHLPFSTGPLSKQQSNGIYLDIQKDHGMVQQVSHF